LKSATSAFLQKSTHNRWNRYGDLGFTTALCRDTPTRRTRKNAARQAGWRDRHVVNVLSALSGQLRPDRRRRTDLADNDANVQWTREFCNAMQPFLANAVYVNYLGDEGEERVRSAYSPATYARLSALKKKYDSANLFRPSQNIKPAP
jgi:hypothetical protein